MGEGVFFPRRHFTERSGVTVGDEEGVVAESILAAGSWSDHAGALSFDVLAAPVRTGEGEYATETGSAVGIRPEFLEQEGIVGRVVSVFACIVGGSDAGFSAQRLDFDSGVVRKGPKVGSQGQGEGFFDRVFLERMAVFDDFGEGRRKLGDRQNVELRKLENFADFACLMGVAGGEEDSHGKGVWCSGGDLNPHGIATIRPST